MHRTARRHLVALLTLGSVAAIALPPPPASASSTTEPITGIASVATDGTTGTGNSGFPAISTGGRYIAFTSAAPDLIPGDTNKAPDVFVRDTLASTTTRVSVSTGGVAGNNQSDQPSISPDGRFVAFHSYASNLVANDTNANGDVFLRDLVAKTTVRVSVSAAGGQLQGGDSSNPVVSADGTKVAFETPAPGVLPQDTDALSDIYLRLLPNGSTYLISATSAQAKFNAPSHNPSMSADGRYIAFDSTTAQLDGATHNGVSDVFLRDRQNSSTELVSNGFGGAATNGPATNPSVSNDGKLVAFQSTSGNMYSVGPKVAGPPQVFLYDRSFNVMMLMSINTADKPAAQGATAPSVSADGSKIAFTSLSPDLVAGDTNNNDDVFVRDRFAATTTRVNVKTGSGGGQLTPSSNAPALSPDGTVTAYQANVVNAFPGDDNGLNDVYWRGTSESGGWTNSLGLLQQSFKDFNGKAPTIGQLVALNDKALSGVSSTEATIDDLAHGTYDDHRGPVIRLYWAFFKRLPDQAGLLYWIKKHEGGMTLKAIASSFATSSEFQTKYSSLTDFGFVQLVYLNVLERPADQAGLDHWVGRLKAGVPRGEMMTGFSESSEGIRHMRGEVDTVLLYEGLLLRMPSKPEFTAGVTLLEGGLGQVTEVLVDVLITSGAYSYRFE